MLAIDRSLSDCRYHVPPACHVTRGDEGVTSCCTSQVCQCEAVQCTVETDHPYEWIDLIDSGTGTLIGAWEQNADDGWFNLDLPFDFMWFGNIERRMTIGTNGILTFGSGQVAI